MAHVVTIDDSGDPRVGDYVLLTDPELRRLRQQSGGAAGEFFIAEGALVIRQLLRSVYRVRSLLLTPPRYEALAHELDDLDAPVFVAEQAVVNSISGFPLHRGALASADRQPLPDAASLLDAAEIVVVTEGLNDHENLGALFRNAAAFGAGTVLLDESSCDPLYRRSIRVSMGHVLHVPFTRVASVSDAVGVLHASGFAVVALTPSPGADDIRDIGPLGRFALVVGAEGPGLSHEALKAADRLARIPMAAGVDSLNVATAAAVALHELRPRSG